MNNKNKLGFFILAIILNAACSSSSFDFSSLTDISTLQATRSDTFFLDDEGLAKVSRATPFKGSNSECSHTGAHVHFTTDGEPYTVDILAPADGVVTDVETCKNIGESDRYGIDLAIANSGSETVELRLSIEPQDGTPCSDGDSDYYEPYIQVTAGQNVSKGQVLGQMLKTASGSDAAHIHYSLGYVGEHDLDICPNLFADDIVQTLVALYDEDVCGETLGDSLCFQPTDEEMILEE